MFLKQFLVGTCLISTAFCVVYNGNILQPQEPVPPPLNSTTVPPPDPTSTTVVTTTSEEPTTTVAPSTSSTTQTPLTHPPTPPPTTTQAPPTTTQAPPVPTTIQPSPPTPKPSKWYVVDGNKTCVLVQMIVNLNVTYPATEGTKYVVFDINGGSENGTQVNGSCANTTQSIVVPFGVGNAINLTFLSNPKTKDYLLSEVKLSINLTALPDSIDNGSTIEYAENKTLFTTPLDMSYKCTKIQSLNLTNSYNASVNYTAVFTISNTQLEAFRTTKEVKFAAAQDCEPLDTPDIVPIAVGCALAALVIVVLVAYLIGRRRSQSRGYVSM